jgi:hypothetical protein
MPIPIRIWYGLLMTANQRFFLNDFALYDGKPEVFS